MIYELLICRVLLLCGRVLPINTRKEGLCEAVPTGYVFVTFLQHSGLDNSNGNIWVFRQSIGDCQATSALPTVRHYLRRGLENVHLLQ